MLRLFYEVLKIVFFSNSTYFILDIKLSYIKQDS
jgi:hypothetical protein